MFLQTDVDATLPVAKLAVSFEYWFTNSDAAFTTLPWYEHISPGRDNSMQENDEPSTNLATCTVLVSKNTGRYRVQSTVLPALWLITNELCNRLEKKWQGDGGVNIKYSESLPLSDFYVAVDKHHETRVSVRSLESALNDLCHQFRIIEKRLLVRFKDSRPAAIRNLDTLMRQTHLRLLQLGTIVEQTQAERIRCSNILACSANLLILLLRFRFSLSPCKLIEISSHLNPDIIAHNMTAYEESLAGWEEITDASLTFMLKSALAKRHVKEGMTTSTLSLSTASTKQTLLLPPPALTFPSTTEKLKRRIAMMCDRLGR